MAMLVSRSVMTSTMAGTPFDSASSRAHWMADAMLAGSNTRTARQPKASAART
jgi:hypothetical protein